MKMTSEINPSQHDSSDGCDSDGGESIDIYVQTEIEDFNEETLSLRNQYKVIDKIGT